MLYLSVLTVEPGSNAYFSGRAPCWGTSRVFLRLLVGLQCTSATDIACIITGIALRSTFVPQTQLQVDKSGGTAWLVCRQCRKDPGRYLGGTSCLIGQEGGITSRQCRMSPPVPTRWACASVAASRCARVERSAEESEHRRQWQSSMETKTRAQAQKYMAQQRGTFSARRMLICSATTATSQEHQGRGDRSHSPRSRLCWD